MQRNKAINSPNGTIRTESISSRRTSLGVCVQLIELQPTVRMYSKPSTRTASQNLYSNVFSCDDCDAEPVYLRSVRLVYLCEVRFYFISTLFLFRSRNKNKLLQKCIRVRCDERRWRALAKTFYRRLLYQIRLITVYTLYRELKWEAFIRADGTDRREESPCHKWIPCRRIVCNCYTYNRQLCTVEKKVTKTSYVEFILV